MTQETFNALIDTTVEIIGKKKIIRESINIERVKWHGMLGPYRKTVISFPAYFIVDLCPAFAMLHKAGAMASLYVKGDMLYISIQVDNGSAF